MFKKQLWVSKARIVCLHKVYPLGTLVSSIPQDQQPFYDFNPHYSGGCGTYRLLTGQTWEMLYCVYNPGPGEHTQMTYRQDVHQYMTEVLQPRLGWKRISSQRLESIKKFLVGKKILLTATEHLYHGENAQEFIPEGYKSWDNYFDVIFKDLH